MMLGDEGFNGLQSKLEVEDSARVEAEVTLDSTYTNMALFNVLVVLGQPFDPYLGRKSDCSRSKIPL